METVEAGDNGRSSPPSDIISSNSSLGRRRHPDSSDQPESADIVVNLGRERFRESAIDVVISAPQPAPERASQTPTHRVAAFEVAERRRSRDQMSNDSRIGFWLCAGLVALSIGSLLTVILVPLAFSDLDYYEMGFLKTKSTGTVDRSKVYTGGRYFIGVDATFKKFRADAHFETFSKLGFFNKEKLEVTMNVTMQYFLMPEELKSLHDAYDLSYRPVLRNTLAAAIKDQATKYSVNEYRQERSKVSQGLFRAAKIALGGTCCYSNCQKYKCLTGCGSSNCTRGLFAYLKYFQLEAVDITDEQEKKFLQTVIEREKRDTEDFKQREKIERKKTEQQKTKIENDALEVKQNAEAKSSLIKAQASASSKAVIENARNSGLQQIYGAVNITNEAHKKSLDYIRTLLNHKSAMLYVGFTTMVAKEGT